MRKWLFICLALIPICVHAYVLFAYTVDFPFEDDFRVIVKYLYLYLSQISWQAKKHMFFLGENESYPLLQRLMVNAQYYFTGQQHIKSMLIACNCLLIFIVTIFYKNAKHTSGYSLAIMSLLIFNTFHHELYFRLDVTSYQFFALFLAICCMYLASKWNSLSLALKIILVVLYLIAPFGSINGVLTHIMVLGIFLCLQNRKAFLTFLALSTAVFLFMQNLGSEGDKSVGFIDNLLKYNFELIYAYFLSVGGMFTFFQGERGYTLGAFFGIIILFVNAYLIFKNYKKGHLFEIFLFLFSAGTLAAVVILRYNYWQLGSRYKLYGAMMCISALMLYLKNTPRPSTLLLKSVLVFVLLVYIIGTVRGLSMMDHQRLTQYVEAHNMGQDVIKPEHASFRYLQKSEQDFLEKNKAFDAQAVDLKLENTLRNAKQLNFNKHSLKTFTDDPSLKGDWGKLETPLHHFKIQGSFTAYKFYFARITDANQKNVITYLFPTKNNFFSPIYTSKTELHTELSHDFYFGFFELQAPFTIQVYGTDSL